MARDDASTFVIGGRLYVGTGMDPTYAHLGDWWCFDPAVQSWTEVAPLPATPRLHCSAFVVDGIGYLFGGIDGAGYLNELWSYDPIANSWTQRPSLPSFGRMSGVGFAIGAYGYVATGRYGPDEAITNELWRFDPATSSWTQHSSLPGEERLLGTAVADAAFGYLLTGQDPTQTGVTDCWRYDPVNDDWTSLQPLPGAPRFGATTCMDGPRAVLLTGATTYPTPYLNDAFLYDAVSAAWTTLPPFIGEGRKGASGAAVPGHGIFFGLGCGNVHRYSDWYHCPMPVGLEEIGLNDHARVILDAQAMELVIVRSDPGTADVTLISVNGGRVVSERIRGERARLGLDGLTSGTYITIIDDQRNRSVHRIVVAR